LPSIIKEKITLNDLLWPIIGLFSLGFAFLSSLSCYSLREFSRSRLEVICEKRGQAKRFGMILKKHEHAILVTETIYCCSLLVLSASGIACLYSNSNAAAMDANSSLLSRVVLIVALSFCTILSTIVFPWSLSRVAGEKVIYHFWPLLSALVTLFKPLLGLTRRVDMLNHRLAGLKEPQEDDIATLNEEIRTVVDEGQREGILESEARTMIHRVIELSEEEVDAIMTPRTDMFYIHVDSSLEDARLKLLKAGHTRVPVIGESTDDIVGILYAKDLLKQFDFQQSSASNNVSLADIVREPFYIPETTGIDTLLQTLKREHIHLAIVLDEYGGVAGLVTMEDILEEIVGEIEDEYDQAESESLVQISPGVTAVDARMHLDDLNEQLELGLPEGGDFETIGGFVFAQMGRIPKPNESITWNQLRITVLEADKRKIDKVKIEVDQSLTTTKTEE